MMPTWQVFMIVAGFVAGMAALGEGISHIQISIVISDKREEKQ